MTEASQNVASIMQAARTIPQPLQERSFVPQLQQSLPLAQTMSFAPATPAVSKSFVAKAAGAIASHSYASLAVIVVLVIVVIGMFVYYRGLWFLGPYAECAQLSKGSKGAAAKSKRKASDDDESGDEKGDPETEKLINAINKH